MYILLCSTFILEPTDPPPKPCFQTITASLQINTMKNNHGGTLNYSILFLTVEQDKKIIEKSVLDMFILR